jgi:hypothetical protein
LWKSGVLAGIATIGGLILVSKSSHSKHAETFAAPRGFPKKLRIDKSIRIEKTPLNQMFFQDEGFYFAPSPSYDENDGTFSYGNPLKSSISWETFNKFATDRRLETPFYRNIPSDEDMKFLHGFFQHQGTSESDIKDLEFMPRYQYADEKAWFESNFSFSPISQSDFNLKWENDVSNDVNQNDRRDAYWTLYTTGQTDGTMDDEKSPIYQNIKSFMLSVIREGLTEKKANSEEDEFEAKIEDYAKNTWLTERDWLSGPLSTRLQLDKNLYIPTLEEAKIMVEFAVLRGCLVIYEAFDKGIAPLISQGWNPQQGAIVENIKRSWDAYQKRSDVPDRTNQELNQIVGSKEEMGEWLWSESFVKKRILKRRGVFIRAIQEDIRKCSLAAGQAGDKAGQEAAVLIKNGLTAIPPFSNLNYYDSIVRTTYYFDDFVEEINKAVEQAGNRLTDAEKQQIRPKIVECFEGVRTIGKAQAKIAYDKKIDEVKQEYDENLNDQDRKYDRGIAELNKRLKV